jgi:kynurenine formamidase
MKQIPEHHQIAREQVIEFMRTLSNWGRWGAEDQLGCLNYITAERRRAAAALVREGVTVSASRALPTEAAPDNPHPVKHLMTSTGLDKQSVASGDYFGLSPHGYATTHLDALCHVFYKDVMYNGHARERVTLAGAELNSIDALRCGIFARGVLLDIPRTKQRAWLEPGEAVIPDDLEESENFEAVRVQSGDFLLIRTGRFAYREKHGPWNAEERLAGLHASCLPWIHQRQIAALGCDGVSDVIPSQVQKIRLPIHLVGIVAMGLHLLDNADLEALAEACGRYRRWEFLLVVAPLVLLKGTASPVNPVAIF